MTIKQISLSEAPRMTPERAKELMKKAEAEDIDYSDIPPINSPFWDSVKVPKEREKEGIFIRLNSEALSWFRSKHKYQILIDNILTAYYERYKNTDSSNK